MTPTQECPGCGLSLPTANGATDPYGGASPACWASFGEVIARDFGEYRYPDVHRLIVDAYMAQHPGFATAAGRRSVVVHLVGLYLVLAKGFPSQDIGPVLGLVFRDKRDAAPLTPVPFLGERTIADVQAARDLAEHARAGRAWADAVWRAWSPHHPTIIAFADAALARRDA